MERFQHMMTLIFNDFADKFVANNLNNIGDLNVKYHRLTYDGVNEPHVFQIIIEGKVPSSSDD